jgi:hypothetical protein
MRKTILTVLGSAVLVASTVQIAAAAEHHRSHRVYRQPAPVAQSFRYGNPYNSNAYYGSDPYDSNAYYGYGYGWGAPYSNWSRYEDAVSRFKNAVESPPAGH